MENCRLCNRHQAFMFEIKRDLGVKRYDGVTVCGGCLGLNPARLFGLIRDISNVNRRLTATSTPRTLEE